MRADRTIGFIEASVANDVCAYRGWDMFAVNARTNHVHLVVAAGCAPEDLVRSLKSWTTRRLVQAGALPDRSLTVAVLNPAAHAAGLMSRHNM